VLAAIASHQLKWLAHRVPIGIGRLGGLGTNGSEDIFIAFSTANPGAWSRTEPVQLEMLSNDRMSARFGATSEATEEAIVNAMVAGKTMVASTAIPARAFPRPAPHEARKVQSLA
jgi:D-aminopeptidase